MKTIELGNTGIKISELGMGALQLTRLEWQQSIRMVREVFKLGVNWFDTAKGYGDSELRLGEAIKGIRDSVCIITKSPSSDPRKYMDDVDASLKRLQTDYIDVMLFHGCGAIEQDGFFEPGGLLETARKAVNSGKVRHIGFSAHSTEIAVKALDLDIMKVAMVPANFISREFIDGEFLDKAREKGVAVLAMKPFGGGRMGNARICLKFLKNYPGVIPVIGIEKTSEMAENIKIWDDNTPLTAADNIEIEKIKQLLGSRFCRMCNYCMPCPQGIEISTVTFLKVFSKQSPRDNVINDRNRACVEKARTCTNCLVCVDRCPFKLDVPGMLRENIQFFDEFSRK